MKFQLLTLFMVCCVFPLIANHPEHAARQVHHVPLVAHNAPPISHVNHPTPPPIPVHAAPVHIMHPAAEPVRVAATAVHAAVQVTNKTRENASEVFGSVTTSAAQFSDGIQQNASTIVQDTQKAVNTVKTAATAANTVVNDINNAANAINSVETSVSAVEAFTNWVSANKGMLLVAGIASVVIIYCIYRYWHAKKQEESALEQSFGKNITAAKERLMAKPINNLDL